MKISSLFLVNGIRVNGKMVTSLNHKDVTSLTVDFTGQVVEIRTTDGFLVVTPFSNVKSMETPNEWQQAQTGQTQSAAQPSGSSSNKSVVQAKATEKQPKQP